MSWELMTNVPSCSLDSRRYPAPFCWPISECTAVYEASHWEDQCLHSSPVHTFTPVRSARLCLSPWSWWTLEEFSICPILPSACPVTVQDPWEYLTMQWVITHWF
jgi:hypothetical protein